MEDFVQYDEVERRHGSASNISDVADQKRKRYSKTRDIYSIEVEDTCDKKTRKRLLVQRSLSLPDVVPSTSPVFYEPQPPPDILHQGGQKKLAIEGPVYKPRPKSVSFFDECNKDISDQGKERRQQLIKKRDSSGYWTGGSDESSYSVDVVTSSEKSQDKGQSLTGDNEVLTKKISNVIPTISLFVFNSNSTGSVYINEAIFNQLKSYDTGLAPVSRTPQSTESVSPLSQYCYDKLIEEKNESVIEQTSVLDNRREVERKLKKELYHVEFERQMLLNKVSDEKIFSFSEGTTPSPHDTVNTKHNNNDLQIPSLQKPKSFDIVNKVEYLHDSSLPDTLEKYSNCHNKTYCGDKTCKEIQSAIKDIRSCIDNQTIPTSLYTRQILLALIKHSQQCKQDICPVPWCNVLVILKEENIKHAVAVLSDYESTLTGCKEIKEYTQICKGYNYGYKEGIDWLSLMPLNKMKNVIIAESLRKTDTRLVIKKTNLNDYHQQLSVYKRLRQFISPYIVQHYWACECGSTGLLICTKFISGIPLNELLLKLPTEEKDICLWMCHILTGVQHLHNYGIIFLKWCSKNIIMVNDNPNDCLKITDLSCSVLSTRRQTEYLEIKQLLPPTIFPPEIDGCAEINEKSDSWGCGCLLYELCMSVPVFNNLCHLKKDEMWKKMKSMPMPDLPKEWQKYQPILDMLWRKKIDDRASIQTVLSQLHDMYKS